MFQKINILSLLLAFFLLGVRPVVAYLSSVMTHEGFLRYEYIDLVEAIPENAQVQIAEGKPIKEVVEWCVDRRNEVKQIIRDKGNPVNKRWAEMRNEGKYGNILGPSYERLKTSIAASGTPEAEIDQKIIEGSGRSNKGVNESAQQSMWIGIVCLVLYLLSSIVVVMKSVNKQGKITEEIGIFLGSLLGGMVGVQLLANLLASENFYLYALLILLPASILGALLFRWLVLKLLVKNDSTSG